MIWKFFWQILFFFSIFMFVFMFLKFTKEGLDEFSSFAIKIVMTGSNPAFAPRITDMRALALAV